MNALIRVLLVLVVGVVLAVGGALFYIDRVAKLAIERGASSALGVETRVGSVRLGLLSGEFGLSGLTVANPEGFEGPHFLALKRGELELRLSELRRDPIVIPLLALSGIELSLEKGRGLTNYSVILNNLSRLEGETPASEPETDAGAEFVIQKLVIRDVTAHARLLLPAGKRSEVEVKVPEIQLRDIGSGSGGGVPMAELASLVTRAILEAVAQNSAGLPRALGGDLRGQLARLGRVRVKLPAGLGGETAKGVQERLRGTAGEVGRRLKGLGSQLRKDRSQD